MRSKPHDKTEMPDSLPAAGTTADDGLEESDVPIEFVAVTVNV